MSRLLSLLFVLLILSVQVFAQVSAVPQLMNFQGRLTRPDGTPVPDGNYSVRFSLWTAVGGGTERWNQTINPVTVRKGTFAVLLSGFPAGTFNGNLWLEIKIGANTPLTPRQQLVSVAYAMKADTVKDGSITGASIANAAITADKFATNIFNPLAWLLGGNTGVANGFLGTLDTHPLELRVNNRPAMRYQYAERTSTPDFEYRSTNVLGGAEINSLGVGVVGATLAGGGKDTFTGTDAPNRVLADFGTVSGGSNNTAGETATVGGGDSNTASGFGTNVGGGISNTASNGFAAVGGGLFNTASGSYSGVTSGQDNIASGDYAAIPGGAFNLAAGAASFAAGFRAQASHDGAFVWADSALNTDFASTGPNQFLIRAGGGVGINTNTPGGASLRVNGGRNNVAVFAGNLAPFGAAGFETNFTSSVTHIWCAENGVRVFSVTAGGYVTCQGLTEVSDARYKTNVQTFPNALDSILNLRGVTFDWKKGDFPERTFADGQQIGFIAQEVEKVLPELVTTDEQGYKSVAYQNVVPVLVEAVKTLKTQKDVEVKALRAENAELRARLNALAAAVAELKAGRR